MAELKFIHAADIHLGSSLHFSNQPLAEYKELFNNAVFDAFKRIVDKAVEEKVDFLLLAGDLYDEEERSIKAARLFNQQCQRLNQNGIDVYMIAGNHDPLDAYKEIFTPPDNLFIFSAEEAEERSIIDDRGQILAQILGQSYRTKSESRKMYSEFSPTRQSAFNIGLLHTQLDANNNNYVPVSKAELKEKSGIDYWALGHIHQCLIENRSNPVIAYPGIPQGRDFGELGLGGSLLVEVDSNHNVEYKLIPTSSLVWKRIEVRIDEEQDSSPKNLADLEELLSDQVENVTDRMPTVPEDLEVINDDWQDYFSGYILQLIIKGRGEIHNLLQKQKEEAVQSLFESLQQKQFDSSFLVWIDSIKLKTAPLLSEAALEEEDNLVFAELSKILELCKSDEQWKDRLKNELGEIWTTKVDHEDIDPERFQMTDRIYDEILEEAKNLIIERIIEGRG